MQLAVANARQPQSMALKATTPFQPANAAEQA